jgi:Domain of unknown function (DUF4190)
MVEPPNVPPPPAGPPPYGTAAPPPWSPPGAPWGYPVQPVAAYARTEPFAIVSLAAALAAAGFCFVGPVVAVVFGHIARSRIKRSHENGSGLALAGLIIGYVELAITAAVVVAVILVAVLTHHDARPTANRLANQIEVVANRSGSSPRNGDVVRRALREIRLGDAWVLVGATNESADVATDDDLRFEGWRLEVDKGNDEVCIYLPQSVTDVSKIVDGPCPRF